MITKEQCIRYLIKVDLEIMAKNEQLNVKGFSTLIELNSDKELQNIKIADVLDYIHYLEEKNGN